MNKRTTLNYLEKDFAFVQAEGWTLGNASSKEIKIIVYPNPSFKV
jgi:hypothetical protein